MKREGSVAIVPLFLAVMLLFWLIAFMGGANDTLHGVNNVTNLQHLQKKLLISAMKYRYTLEQDARKNDTTLTDEELDEKVNIYINEIMALNKIQE